MSRYLAVGSVCWDRVEGEAEPRLGGSVLFAARVAVEAGWDATIITSGTRALEAALRAAVDGIDVEVQRSTHDTVMAFGRAADLGPQSVPSVADPIELGVATASLVADADVVHLAPIMGEVTPDLLPDVRAARFVGLTPQGLLRRRSPKDHHLELIDSVGPWWAAGVDAVVVSEAEFARIDPPIGPEVATVAVTRGERGCTGRVGVEEVDLPGVALDAHRPAGAIGAGDVFAATLFMALVQGASFAEAMDRANRRAAAHVGGDR